MSIEGSTSIHSYIPYARNVGLRGERILGRSGLEDMKFSRITCANCGDIMIPEVKYIKLDENRTIIEVIWKCRRCGAIRGAWIGTG
jgi:RNase P subunit RPR2